MSEIDRLIGIMARLRDPDGGCPWDLEQDFASIAPYTIEEAYEVADAIARNDMEDLRDELGDLLLQVVYHARLASESGAFSFDDVARSISEKLVRRHPHVFGDAGERPVEAVRRTWEDTKARERAERGARRGNTADADDPFSDVPLALPALRRSAKLLGRADRAGRSDPPGLSPGDAARALSDLAEAAGGEGAPADDAGAAARRERVGELLLAVVSLARTLGVDAERALQERNHALVKRARRGDSD